MGTIEEMENKMTIYFSKRNGEIKSIAGGIQDMNTFGVDKEDYELIWNYIVLDRDSFVMSNPIMFKINLEDNKLVMKDEFKNRY